jgi:DNA repair exonuclease SbcCD ATPase subunit
VDDKVAKNLLGDTFRRQLKFDGTYSAVTFICSKTDDISITEAVDSLGLHNEMTEFDDELGVIDAEQRELKKKIKELKGDKEALTDASEEAEENLEKWEALKDKMEDGESIYPPPESNKRKDLAELDQNSTESFDGTPLTIERIDQEISELRRIKKDARRQRGIIDTEVKELNAKNKQIDAKLDAIDAKKSAMCIAGRNRYSMTAIQQDFAAGIREMDNEIQEEENPDNFDPEDEVRDYQQVAESLPVFCVSSRAYQKLSGRMVKVSIDKASLKSS